MTHEPTAVLAWHGMGQQIPFETTELVARVLARDESRRTGRHVAAVPRLVKLGTQKLWRVELELTSADGSRHPVHVYEVYWAPLTQGKITLGETVRLLLNAGLNGFRFGLLPPRVLPRYLFGRWVEFPLRPSLAALFLLLLLVVVALVIVNFTITTTLVVRLLNLNDPTAWPDYALLSDLTVDLGWLAAAFAAAGSGLGLAYFSQQTNWREAMPSTRRALPQAIIWTLVGIALLTTVIVGALVTWHLLVHQFVDARQWTWRPSQPVAVVVWTAVIAGSVVVRWFMLEYLGDTGIYVSSHKVNRFFETRQAIRDYSCAVTTAIYEFGGYQRHILVGHSLGSAVAYDTFNQMANDDKLREPLHVTARTRLFLSFGSVLDKTAFLFRVQTTYSDIREILAAAVQPLISNAGARPPWINIYSPHDPLGGSLEYYDPTHGLGRSPGDEFLPPPVSNVVDPDAWIPLIAHVQYWTNRAFVSTLAAAITDQTPPARVG